jgi:phenylacetate-CoA ligase
MSSWLFDSLTATLIRSSVVPLWARWEKSAYLEHIAFLNKNQYRPSEDINREQRQKLSAVLSHAYQNCPYYQTIFSRVCRDPAQIMARFSEIPILTKEDIRRNKDQMCARNFPPKKLIPKKTSGSTGVSLELFMDIDCSEWRRAVAIFRNSWTGWRLGEKTAAVWGNPPPAANWRAFLRNALLERCIYLDTLGMDEDDMAFFLEKLPRYQPTLMMGHAYSLYLFAKFVEKHPRAPKPCLKGIISTAMILYPWQRETIERVFHCKIFERYGCEEVSLIASECEAHSGMHINTDSLIVEFLNDDDRPAMEGEETSVVVTDLMNYGMPIIRYRIGDKAVFTNQACSCGRGSALITKVTGRDADFIVTPQGKIISGISLTENFSLKIPGVEQMQIEQLRRDHLRIKIVRDPNFNEGSERLLADLSKRTFGDTMRWETVFVDKIPQERNGKYRFVISHLGK